MENLVSIIVPVYNVEKYIERCCRSLLQQTYTDIEIILVDDGSTDQSGVLCDDIANRNEKKIRVVHKKNGGLSSARNEGIKLAKGNYITFVDSDDFLEKNAIAYMYNLIESRKADIVIGNIVRTNKDFIENENTFLVEEMQIDKMDVIRKLNEGDNLQVVSACAKLYKKELFDELCFPEGDLHEDEATTYKIYFEANKIIVSNKIVYGYYYNDNSITTKPSRKNYGDMLKAMSEQIEYWEKHGNYGMADKVRNRTCIQIVARVYPIGYYESVGAMRRRLHELGRKTKNYSEMNFKERLKGAFARKCPLLAGALICLKQFKRVKIINKS